MSRAAPVSEEAQAPRGADPDSRARTHLANERTFLAWLRTGLSLVAVGMATAGFLSIDLVPSIPYVTLFSVLFVLAGVVTVMVGAARYLTASRQIEHGRYDPGRTPMVAIAMMVALLSVLALPLIMLLQ